MSTFHLEIITPERLAYEDEVEMVTAPTAMGVVGILPNHVPLFSRLIEGEVKVTKGKEEYFLAIGGGFVEVTKQRVCILVSRAVHAHELNEMEIKKAQERAREALDSGVKGYQLREAQLLLRRSLLEMKVLRRRRRSLSTHPN